MVIEKQNIFYCIKVAEALDPTHVAEMMKHMAQVAQMVMGDQRDSNHY